jgi:hypothetical protein
MEKGQVQMYYHYGGTIQLILHILTLRFISLLRIKCKINKSIKFLKFGNLGFLLQEGPKLTFTR